MRHWEGHRRQQGFLALSTCLIVVFNMHNANTNTVIAGSHCLHPTPSLIHSCTFPPTPLPSPPLPSLPSALLPSPPLPSSPPSAKERPSGPRYPILLLPLDGGAVPEAVHHSAALGGHDSHRPHTADGRGRHQRCVAHGGEARWSSSSVTIFSYSYSVSTVTCMYVRTMSLRTQCGSVTP